jgi:hypothetical protein
MGYGVDGVAEDVLPDPLEIDPFPDVGTSEEVSTVVPVPGLLGVVALLTGKGADVVAAELVSDPVTVMVTLLIEKDADDVLGIEAELVMPIESVRLPETSDVGIVAVPPLLSVAVAGDDVLVNVRLPVGETLVSAMLLVAVVGTVAFEGTVSDSDPESVFKLALGVVLPVLVNVEPYELFAKLVKDAEDALELAVPVDNVPGKSDTDPELPLAG